MAGAAVVGFAFVGALALGGLTERFDRDRGGAPSSVCVGELPPLLGEAKPGSEAIRPPDAE